MAAAYSEPPQRGNPRRKQSRALRSVRNSVTRAYTQQIELRFSSTRQTFATCTEKRPSQCLKTRHRRGDETVVNLVRLANISQYCQFSKETLAQQARPVRRYSRRVNTANDQRIQTTVEFQRWLTG